jgi:hypothetical protein
MQTLIDPFEINPSFGAYVPPPSRPPMATLSVDVDVEYDIEAAIEERIAAQMPPAPRSSSHLDSVPESWSRVRCWCSED